MVITSESHKKHEIQSKCSYIDKFHVTLAAFVRDAGKVWVAFLAVLADDAAVVILVLTQEAFRVVVAVDVDLSERVVRRRLNAALVDPRLQPRQQQLQSTHSSSQVVNRQHTIGFVEPCVIFCLDRSL